MSIFSRGFNSVNTEPTEKQIKLANNICIFLGKKFPGEYTKEAYRKFISDNMEEYKHEREWADALQEQEFYFNND